MVIRKAFCHMTLALSLLAASGLITPAASGAVTAGGLAVVGFSDDDSGAGGSDDFVLLATTDIMAGEVIYFTNTPWTESPDDFYGVTSGTKSGTQQLLKVTINQTISKGSILSTATAASSAYTWTNSTAIGGSGPTNFSKLDLFSTGDQIYIFQSSSSTDPMDVNLSTLDFVYLFDSGEPGYDGFNQSFDGVTDGMIPSGLGTGAFTANELTPGSFNNGTFGFNMSLLAPSGSASDWLEAIANSSNWTLNTLPTTGVSAVPEPSRVLLMSVALGTLAFRRRRNVNKRS
jgi:hypothetical protein